MQKKCAKPAMAEEAYTRKKIFKGVCHIGRDKNLLEKV